MRKTKKHTVYSIEEKNEITRQYLSGEINFNACVRTYDISGKSVLERWVKQVRLFGTVVDRRGQNKPGGRPKGRAKKVDLNSLSKAELISIIEVYADIKKTSAYLRVPRKSIKSSLN